MPQRWLTILLRRLDSSSNSQQVFILRRSAGFAYSFLSLLRAEPSNCKATLLPFAMTRLLQIAADNTSISMTATADPSSEDWRMSVHALNVIRLILLDAALGGEVDVFVEDAIVLTVHGFRSPHWAVRNSCMMVFAAVLQRAIDQNKTSEAGSSVRAPTVFDFFERFPRLLQFLLDELTANIVKQLETNLAVYPVLLLLSKLRAVLYLPSIETEGTSTSSTTVGRYIPVILESLQQRCAKIRLMAAKAIVAFIPITIIPTFIKAIFNDLMLDGNNLTLNANCTHGILCCILELLRNLQRHFLTLDIHSPDSEMDCSKFDTSESYVSRLLVDLETIVRKEMIQAISCNLTKRFVSCYPILDTWTCILELLQSLCRPMGRTSVAVLSEQLMHHCNHILSSLPQCSRLQSALTRVPFESLAWMKVVQYSVAAALTECDIYSVPGNIQQMIQHYTTDVRGGALMGLQQALSSSCEMSSRLIANLVSVLVDRLMREQYPPLLELALNILNR